MAKLLLRSGLNDAMEIDLKPYFSVQIVLDSGNKLYLNVDKDILEVLGYDQMLVVYPKAANHIEIGTKRIGG